MSVCGKDNSNLSLTPTSALYIVVIAIQQNKCLITGSRFILAVTRINLDLEDVVAYNVLCSGRSTIY